MGGDGGYREDTTKHNPGARIQYQLPQGVGGTTGQDPLRLRGVSWPRGSSQLHFQLTLQWLKPSCTLESVPRRRERPDPAARRKMQSQKQQLGFSSALKPGAVVTLPSVTPAASSSIAGGWRHPWNPQPRVVAWCRGGTGRLLPRGSLAQLAAGIRTGFLTSIAGDGSPRALRTPSARGRWLQPRWRGTARVGRGSRHHDARVAKPGPWQAGLAAWRSQARGCSLEVGIWYLVPLLHGEEWRKDAFFWVLCPNAVELI